MSWFSSIISWISVNGATVFSRYLDLLLARLQQNTKLNQISCKLYRKFPYYFLLHTIWIRTLNYVLHLELEHSNLWFVYELCYAMVFNICVMILSREFIKNTFWTHLDSRDISWNYKIYSFSLLLCVLDPFGILSNYFVFNNSFFWCTLVLHHGILLIRTLTLFSFGKLFLHGFWTGIFVKSLSQRAMKQDEEEPIWSVAKILKVDELVEKYQPLWQQYVTLEINGEAWTIRHCFDYYDKFNQHPMCIIMIVLWNIFFFLLISPFSGSACGNFLWVCFLFMYHRQFHQDLYLYVVVELLHTYAATIQKCISTEMSIEEVALLPCTYLCSKFLRCFPSYQRLVKTGIIRENTLKWYRKVLYPECRTIIEVLSDLEVPNVAFLFPNYTDEIEQDVKIYQQQQKEEELKSSSKVGLLIGSCRKLIPNFELMNEEEKQELICPICHAEFQKKERIVQIQCFNKHNYHQSCLHHWWKTLNENEYSCVQCTTGVISSFCWLGKKKSE